jgi:hypothetical protein
VSNVTTIPVIRCQYLGEPGLEFADGRIHVDPKLGISRFGPKSYSPRKHHPSNIRVGVIGSGETIGTTRRVDHKKCQRDYRR